MFKINQSIYNQIGELGVYIYTLSLFISKSGVNIGLGFLVLAFLLYLWDKRKIRLTTEEKYILVSLFYYQYLAFSQQVEYTLSKSFRKII